MKINWLKILKERFMFYPDRIENDGKKDMTVGKQRVRIKFNPSNDSLVDVIKQKSAWLIDICEQLKNKDARLASLAQTYYEIAAMVAVKAATAETPTD